jgi:hypothetical protein
MLARGNRLKRHPAFVLASSLLSHVSKLSCIARQGAYRPFFECGSHHSLPLCQVAEMSINRAFLHPRRRPSSCPVPPKSAQLGQKLGHSRQRRSPCLCISSGAASTRLRPLSTRAVEGSAPSRTMWLGQRGVAPPSWASVSSYGSLARPR